MAKTRDASPVDGTALTVERVPLGDLVPHPRNPRVGDPTAIAESLVHNGQYKPLVVSSDGVILAGNHTYQAARDLGWAELAVVRLPVAGDSQAAERILLADNRTTDFASYDDQALADVLTDLAQSEVGLVGSVWDADDLAEVLAQLQRAEAAQAVDPDTPFTPGNAAHRGEYGAIGDNEQRSSSYGSLIASYADGATRSLVFSYTLAEYAEAVDALTDARERRGLESHAEVVLELIREEAARHANG